MAGAFTGVAVPRLAQSGGRRSAAPGADTSTSIPPSTDTPVSPTPEALDDEKGATAAGFLERAKTWFAAHGIATIERIVTDNGACYRSKAFAEAARPARQQRITPYTPRHNGKVERYNRILAEEFLWHPAPGIQSANRADGLVLWNQHYNYHRPHGAHHGRPPASATPVAVNNVLASYS